MNPCPFLCPVCKQPLTPAENRFICPSNHCYDRAKSGYVNLFLSQSRRSHGDDKEMIRARKRFLDQGYYLSLSQRINSLLLSLLPLQAPVVLDAGCGECWYTARLYEDLAANTTEPTVIGVDLSKTALAEGAKRSKGLQLAVANCSQLPVADCACDCILSLFAPYDLKEITRALRPGGFFLRVVPLERHLWSLKQAIYDTPYENPSVLAELDGFQIHHRETLKKVIYLHNAEDINSLFLMTPYSHRTRKSDLEKLQKLQELETEIEFEIAVYKQLHKYSTPNPI